MAASDYLDPLFLPQLVAQIKQQAPLCRIEIHAAVRPTPTTARTWRRARWMWWSATGRSRPTTCTWARLFGDEVVCLVASDHPAVRRGWDSATWLAAEHIAPTPTHPGASGVIDEHLDSLGLQRNITARCPHFGLIPAMVASSLLVLTTGRQYCERFTGPCCR